MFVTAIVILASMVTGFAYAIWTSVGPRDEDTDLELNTSKVIAEQILEKATSNRQMLALLKAHGQLTERSTLLNYRVFLFKDWSTLEVTFSMSELGKTPGFQNDYLLTNGTSIHYVSFRNKHYSLRRGIQCEANPGCMRYRCI